MALIFTASGYALGEQPAIDEKEEVTFERQIGWYFEGRGGAFFTVGATRGYSNAQPFYGFEFGYDVTPKLSLQFIYASGYQAANPLCRDDQGLVCTGYHEDFGLAFFDLGADYDLFSGRRWAFEARLGGGVTVISPAAKPDHSPVDGNFFAGLRFEYYTLLKHFTLGLESDFFYVLPTGIPAIAIAASILYNF
jgi:hypothetical protein